MRVGPHRLAPGDLLRVPPDKLGVAAHLVRVKTAKPADRRTELDVALFELARRAPDGA